jgi:hypothetical protein
MRNCILSKKDRIVKEKSYLFGIINKGDPYIVFELNDKKDLVEAKKNANRELSSTELRIIKSIINRTESN